MTKPMAEKNHASESDKKSDYCGIVMPISGNDECSGEHWSDVKAILDEVILATGLAPNLVSNASYAGVILKEIVENLYNNKIVVCDVSTRNANVMFELGMRLAFDKPTIIIKDDKTPYSFDTSPIRHLDYPRDLRFNQIVKFKSDLEDLIRNTLKESESSSDYTTFLGHFGKFQVAKIETEEVSSTEFIFEELRSIRTAIQKLPSPLIAQQSSQETETEISPRVLCFQDAEEGPARAAADAIEASGLVPALHFKQMQNGHWHITLPSRASFSRTSRGEILRIARGHVPTARWLPAPARLS